MHIAIIQKKDCTWLQYRPLDCHHSHRRRLSVDSKRLRSWAGLQEEKEESELISVDWRWVYLCEMLFRNSSQRHLPYSLTSNSLEKFFCGLFWCHATSFHKPELFGHQMKRSVISQSYWKIFVFYLCFPNFFNFLIF